MQLTLPESCRWAACNLTLCMPDNTYVPCRYTFNTAANAANSTFTNLKERSGFIIEPFTVPIATAAAAYKFKHDDYIIEPQYDFHKNSAYLSVQRDR